MKKILILLLAIAWQVVLFAQPGIFSVRVIVPQEDIPSEAKAQLLSKLRQIATNYGMVEDGLSNRFVLTADALVMTKDVVPVTPPRISQKLDIVLYFGDVVEEKVFSSLTLPVTGVGQSDNKAYINAFSRIPVKSGALAEWAVEVKKKVQDYYDSRGASILAEADFWAQSGDFDAALASLLSVPDFCSSADLAKEKALKLYQQKLDNEGEALYQEAKTIWTVGQDEDAAQQALALLSEINVSSAASGSAASLAESIGKQMNSRRAQREEQKKVEMAKEEQKVQRNWEFQMKQYEDQMEIQREQVKSQTAVERAKADAIKTASDKVAGIDFGKVAKVITGWFAK